MKAYGLLALTIVLTTSVGGTPASAQNLPEELRHFFHERHEEFKEDRDGVRDVMFRLHRACEAGDQRACIQFGMVVGENREHREGWRREHPELFGWEHREGERR
jgi:hypothetical protein